MTYILKLQGLSEEKKQHEIAAPSGSTQSIACGGSSLSVSC